MEFHCDTLNRQGCDGTIRKFCSPESQLQLPFLIYYKLFLLLLLKLFNTRAMGTNLKLLLIAIILVWITANPSTSQVTVGPNSPGTGTNVATGFGNAWSNPTNVTASDNSYASVSLSFFAFSDALVASNFGFSIPGTATIDGITVSIEKNGTGNVSDFNIQLTKNGTTPIGSNYAQFFVPWPGSDTNVGYGGAADLWGTTWTPVEINSSSFGVYIIAVGLNLLGSSVASIDHVTVTIDYTIPTPVELVNFEGEVIEEVIELYWRTTWEDNNDFFTIEKSANGLNYFELGTIEGNGTTELISDYSFTDPLPFEGNNYYRLSQTDFDGAYEIFKPIVVNYEKEGLMFKLFPNPVLDDYINLIVDPDLLKGEGNNTYVLIRNLTGEALLQQTISTTSLGNKITLNRRLASGMYILELHSPYGTSSKKFVVN